MARIITTENPDRDAVRYVRHWANVEYVRSELVERGMPAALSRRKSKEIAYSIAQGAEYIENAKGSSLLTKPLPLFYGVENMAKAVCLSLSTTINLSDFKHHGLIQDKARRNSVANIICTIVKGGVWSQAFELMNGDNYTVEMRQGLRSVTTDVRRDYYSPYFIVGRTLQLRGLLARIPELVDDLLFAKWGPSTVVHAPTVLFEQGDPSQPWSARFVLRHAHDQPTRDNIMQRASACLPRYKLERDDLDILEYACADAGRPGSTGSPFLRQDVFGESYLDLSPRKQMLGELLVHLAALFILSSTVRYHPDQWKRLIDDHPSEAILIERYLEIASRKAPNLVLNELERALFQFRFAR